MVFRYKTAFARQRFDDALALQFRVGFRHRIPIDAQLLGERTDGWQWLSRLQGAGCGRRFNLVHQLQVNGLAGLKIELNKHGEYFLLSYDNRTVGKNCQVL